MTVKKITTPLTDEVISDLKAGDRVEISGVLYTARDAAHKRLVQMIKDGDKLTIDLRGQVIYFVGPTPARPGMPIGSAGPTEEWTYIPRFLFNMALKG